jgi:hypothetical protein
MECDNKENDVQETNSAWQVDAETMQESQIKRLRSCSVENKIETISESFIIDNNQSKLSFQGNCLILSQDEKSMNGAPEGNLYNFEVLDDENLKSFNIDEINIVLTQLSADSDVLDSLLWHERCVVIESFRRLLLHHASFITTELSNKMIFLIFYAIESLRSVECKNGILALRNLMVQRFQDMIPSMRLKGFQSLAHRMSSGPKFINEIAILSGQHIIQRIPFNMAAEVLTSLLQSKSGPSTNFFITLLCECVQRIDIRNESHLGYLSSLLNGLRLGLISKKLDVKLASRDALCRLSEIIGLEAWESLLSLSLDNKAASEIRRDIEKSKTRHPTLSQSKSFKKLTMK